MKTRRDLLKEELQFELLAVSLSFIGALLAYRRYKKRAKELERQINQSA